MCITDLIDDPVSAHKYKIYDIDKLPTTLLCISVKNKYDEARVNIKKRYSPKYVSHFQNINNMLQPSYYYGIELKLRPQFRHMIGEIVNSNIFGNSRTSGKEKLFQYTTVLSEYGMSCNTCFGYFTDGIWPIDLYHLNHMSETDLSKEISSGFTSMISPGNKQDAPYTRLLNFNILTMAKCTGYDN